MRLTKRGSSGRYPQIRAALIMYPGQNGEMFNFNKLKSAIHYICEKASDENLHLDSIKLNKALWYSDTRAYLESGSSITGSSYIRKKHGPVAKYNTVALAKLKDEGRVLTGKRDRKGKWEKCFDPIQPASKDPFLGKELQVMDEAIQRVCKEDSFDLSERTHGEIWKLAPEGEEIPLYTVFAESLGKVTQEHIKLATADLGA